MGLILFIMVLLGCIALFALLGCIAFFRVSGLQREVGALRTELNKLRARIAQLSRSQVSPPPVPAPEKITPEPKAEKSPGAAIPTGPDEEKAPEEIEPSSPKEEPKRPVVYPPPKPADEERPLAEAARAHRERREAGSPPTVPPATPPTPRKPWYEREGLGFEINFGVHWIGWLGILLVLIGTSFFLRYAYDNDWIGPKGRLAIGVLAGLASLGMGEFLKRRDFRVLHRILTGGGISIFYVCLYFSFQVYELAGPERSLALAVLVTISAIALAVANDSLSIAILAVVGGFLSPFLFQHDFPPPDVLFPYIFILNLLALGAAYFRRWRRLDELTFIGTYLIYCIWYFGNSYGDSIRPALVYNTVFYLQFLIVPSLHNLVRRLPETLAGMALVAANAIVSLFIYSVILLPDFRYALGFVVLGQALVVFLLFLVWTRRMGKPGKVSESLLVIALALITLAIPIQLRLYGVPLAWATEGALFVYLGMRFEKLTCRIGGIAALFLACIGLLIRLPLHDAPFIPVFNIAFGSWAYVIGALGFAAWQLSGLREEKFNFEKSLRIAPGLAGYIFGCILLTMEVDTFWRFSESLAAHNYRHDSFAVLWGVIPLVTTIVLTRWGKTELLAVAWAAYAVGALFFITGLTAYSHPSTLMFVNVSFFARAVFVVLASVGAVLLSRHRPAAIPHFAIAIGCFLFVCLLLTLEVDAFWRTSEHILANAYRHDSFAILWAVIPLFTIVTLLAFQRAELLPFALIVYAIGSLFFLVGLGAYSHPSHLFLLNFSFFARLIFLVSLGTAAVLFGKFASSSTVKLAPGIACYVFACMLLTLEVDAFWRNSEREMARFYRHDSFAVLWALIPLTTLIALRWKNRIELFALAAAAYGVGALFVFSGLALYSDSSTLLFLNLTFASRVLFIVSAWVGAALAGKASNRNYAHAIEMGAHFLFVLLLGFELNRWGQASEWISHKMALGLISAFWGVFAFVLIILGLAKRRREQRIAGFAIFAVTIGKLFLFDMQELERVYQIISFIVSGVLLLVITFLYQKFRGTLLSDGGDSASAPPVPEAEPDEDQHEEN